MARFAYLSFVLMMVAVVESAQATPSLDASSLFEVLDSARQDYALAQEPKAVPKTSRQAWESPIGALNNIQEGDMGDRSWPEVELDVDDDGKNETVSLLFDDESGRFYAGWVAAQNIVNDKRAHQVVAFATLHPDGTADLVLSVVRLATYLCARDGDGDTACQQCGNRDTCVDISPEDIYAAFDF